MKRTRILQSTLGSLVAIVLGMSSTIAAGAQTAPKISELFVFPCNVNGCPNGGNPTGALIQASDGDFYGTTFNTNPLGFRQGGTIFRVTAAGQLTTLFTFVADQNGKFSAGSSPAAGLAEGRDGFLYGTTEFGGASNSGVLFRIEKNGSGFQVLHNFCSAPSCGDGGNPAAPLFQGTDGNLYGTTGAGGASAAGVIFRISPSDSFTTLHNFNSSTEGTLPSGLIQATDGNFYGNVRRFGPLCGATYRLTPAGQFTVLKHFPQPSECFPVGELVQASSGLLYGDTFYGEEFQISLSGAYQALGIDIPGGGLKTGPTGLTQASDGNLWGSQLSGSSGSVFALSTVGSLVVEANFDCQASKLLQGADGKFYGAGGACGDNFAGNIFAVDAGLPTPRPSIGTFTPASGKAGSQVTLSGDHFIGTTTVSFNGASATFKVLNTNYITATVPLGATSGPIAVTNAGGSAKSASTFRVQ